MKVEKLASAEWERLARAGAVRGGTLGRSRGVQTKAYVRADLVDREQVYFKVSGEIPRADGSH